MRRLRPLNSVLASPLIRGSITLEARETGRFRRSRTTDKLIYGLKSITSDKQYLSEVRSRRTSRNK